MAVYIDLEKACPACSGNGTQTFNTESPYDEDCGRCGGSGYLPWGRLNVTDLSDTLADILDKCKDIKEKVDEL